MIIFFAPNEAMLPPIVVLKKWMVKQNKFVGSLVSSQRTSNHKDSTSGCCGSEDSPSFFSLQRVSQLFLACAATR
jgi:hypothetical protein